MTHVRKHTWGGAWPRGAIRLVLGVATALTGPAACRGDRQAAPARPATPATQPAATRPATPWTPPAPKGRDRQRRDMVRVIRRHGLSDAAVLKAMSHVARHEFVPDRYSRQAYADTPLPIGHGQTISQPYIVAEMTRQLKLTKDSRVLEIGTGSGYQAAVLTQFTRHVHSIEIVKPLADEAARRLQRLGYSGWAEAGPFDAIIVTCAAGQVPPPLIKQLKPGGRMVIPVGGAFSVQQLLLIEKRKDGTVRSRSLMAVRFVPLTRKKASAR